MINLFVGLLALAGIILACNGIGRVFILIITLFEEAGIKLNNISPEVIKKYWKPSYVDFRSSVDLETNPIQAFLLVGIIGLVIALVLTLAGMLLGLLGMAVSGLGGAITGI